MPFPKREEFRGEAATEAELAAPLGAAESRCRRKERFSRPGYNRMNPRDAQEAYQALLHKRAKKLFTMFDWTLL